MRRRVVPVLALAAVVAFVAAACGGNDYHYIDNASANAFFKVPSSWKVYRINDEQPTDRPAAIDTNGTKPWHVVFDSDPSPALEHADATAPTHVAGQAVIIPLSPDQGDQLSTKDLRSYFIGQDPLDLADSNSSTTEIVSFEQINTPEGLRGSRVVFNMKDGDVWSTFDQTTFMDAAAKQVYLFDARCESACFKQNVEEIRSIVDSWQVKK